MRALIVLVSVAVLAGAMSADAADRQIAAVLTGTALVKDGDGVLFGQVEIRLQGIAAPEDSEIKREPGGAESTASLAKLVNGQTLRCELDGTIASSNRPVAVCFMLDGTDIGDYQVRRGHARDCPAFSRGRYAPAENQARAKGRDLGAIYPLPAYCTAR